MFEGVPLDCVSCGEPVPAPATGRRPKMHAGDCRRKVRAASERARQRATNPRRDVCRLCGDPVAPGRLYYCDGDCDVRYERLNQRERNLVARFQALLDVDVSTASAAELLPGMSPLAVQWRRRRAERIGYALAA